MFEKLNFPLAIKEKMDYFFDADSSGLYAISISARVKSAGQINGTDDEDLQIEIDNRKFREIPEIDKPQYKDIAPAFNGSKLKGVKKTVMFFIWFEKGSHNVSLIPDNSALVDDVSIKKMEDSLNINIEINEQAEDGDRRPWFSFIFVDLSIKKFSASIIAKSRWFDRDDAQIKIDGEIQQYKNANFLHRFWYWIGSLRKGKEDVAVFKPNLSKGLHYIEINADRMPTLKQVAINLGNEQEEAKEEEGTQGGKNENKIQKYDQFHGISGKEDYDRFDKEIKEAVDYWNDFFAAQEYPPEELLDYNLVKAIIYKETRIGYFKTNGYPSYPDVMQVGDTDNPALATLREEPGYKGNEFVSKDTRKHLSYSFPAERMPVKVESLEESIFWGVRWLYHKAQIQYGTTEGDRAPYVREWKTWKQAVIDYNGSLQKYEYQKLVWRIYKNGIDPNDNPLWKIIGSGFSLILALILFSTVLVGISAAYYSGYKAAFQNEAISDCEDDVGYNEERHTDYSEETRDIIEQVFLKNLEDYKKEQYNYGDIFDETVKECEKRHCWMEIVMRGYYKDLAENMRSNKQFLDATEVFNWIDPKVADIDNDGENEILFVTTDILNSDFIIINVIDKIEGEFKLLEKKFDFYSGHVELADLTSDIIPEIILYYSYGRWGDNIAVLQYKNHNLEEMFNNGKFIFSEFTLSDENNNGLAEVKIKGRQFGINPVGDECSACHHTEAEEIYEYERDKNNFSLISQKYFGISGALYDAIGEIKSQGKSHRLLFCWPDENQEERDYFLKKINMDNPDHLFTDIFETSIEDWNSLDLEPSADDVWILVKRLRISAESEEMRENNVPSEIINAQGPFYKIFFKRKNENDEWGVEKMETMLK